MNSFFVYRDVTQSDALEVYALKRLDKIKKYLKKDAPVHIAFEKRGREHICSVGIDGRLYFKLKKSTESMYDAVDLCVLSLKNTLSKDKDRCKTKWERSKGFKAANEDELEDCDCEYDYEDFDVLSDLD